MKPAGNVAHRADYEIRKCPFAEARAFIVEHHYAKGAANTATECFGLFKGGVLVGAALWMPPTRVCAESVDKEGWRTVLSLSRLAIHPDEPKNAASLFIGACIRTLHREGRWTCLVTFADERQGHTGAIYMATNWKYLGRTKPEPVWLDKNGKQVSRLATKSRTAEQMKDLAYTMVGKFAKHKYVMRLRSVADPAPTRKAKVTR